MKRCGACDLTKPLTEFHRRGAGHQAWCIECRREYDADYYQRTRTTRLEQKRAQLAEIMAWYRELKSGRPCQDCGGIYHPAAMEWDHLPGAVKVAEVSRFLQTQRSKQAILAEIAKCELVCANCHAVRTYERSRGVAQSG